MCEIGLYIYIFIIDNCLPEMYWLPKIHKIPSKSRFIVAACKCSIKLLTKKTAS